jgi:hypothetical protein
MIVILHKYSRKMPVIPVRLQSNLNFPNRPSKNTQTLDFINIRPAGAELFHVDRWTDGHDKTNSRFSQFCKAPKDEQEDINALIHYAVPPGHVPFKPNVTFQNPCIVKNAALRESSLV